jgi:hypothetical protein
MLGRVTIGTHHNAILKDVGVASGSAVVRNGASLFTPIGAAQEKTNEVEMLVGRGFADRRSRDGLGATVLLGGTALRPKSRGYYRTPYDGGRQYGSGDQFDYGPGYSFGPPGAEWAPGP